jgi:hypothetical protein
VAEDAHDEPFGGVGEGLDLIGDSARLLALLMRRDGGFWGKGERGKYGLMSSRKRKVRISSCGIPFSSA